MAGERKELFISYGREPDVIQFVQRLKSDLESNGFSVWLDTRDIPAGSDWRGAIGAGLSQCKAILPVITSRFIGSRYCVNELYTADGEKKYVFPIMFEDVDFSSMDSGHGVKFVIGGVNWTMCRPGMDDYSSSISRLMQGMRDKGLGGSGEDKEDKDREPVCFSVGAEHSRSKGNATSHSPICTPSHSHKAWIDALVGTYENHQYDNGGKNAWHYVTLTHLQGKVLQWKNTAGVIWTLSLTEDRTRLAVGTNCPYYNDGHTICTVVYATHANTVAALLGPWNERYDRE